MASRILAGLLLAAALCGQAWAGGGFADWAVVVVAGDDHAAHADRQTDAFDNARHDVTEALVGRGFSRDNMAQFSVRPWRFADTILLKSDRESIADSLGALANRARGGCLAYFTSHGSPDGMVLGSKLLSPVEMDDIVGGACGERPTIVIVSACFSGVFVPALRGPRRLILTAARPDRSSFGCGESDHYPFFDGCVIEALPDVVDPIDLARRVMACVAGREKREGMSPPSEPQLYIGDAIRTAMPAFSASPGGWR